MAKQKKNYKIRITIFLILSCIICATFFFNNQLETWLNNIIYPEIDNNVEDCELKVHFIDVGQGDSILIELPDDKIMLVDAGPGSGEEKLTAYLSNFFSTQPDLNIDYFIITHQDEDHIGGADKVFDNYNVLSFYRPNVYTPEEILNSNLTGVNSCETNVFKTTINKMYAEGCNWFVNEENPNLLALQSGCGYTIEFLGPIDQKYTKPNNYSPIMIITYQNRKIMLTGDAEELVEDQVIDKYGSYLQCDVLKLGHHGSSSSTTQDFLDAVNPTYAVICVGEGNDYNHPNETVLARVNNKIGSHNVYRTDTFGNIIFGIDKDSITSGKAEIKISYHKGTVVKVYIKWWYVVVLIEGILFVVIILPKAKQKKVIKQLKKSQK